MKASDIICHLVKDSVELEYVGIIHIPEDNIHDYFDFMFGPGTHEVWGFVSPDKTYLYCYGSELDEIHEVLLRNDDSQTIALVRID